METKCSSKALTEGVVRQLYNVNQKSVQKACRKLVNTWIFNNTNKRYLVIQSRDCIYLACSRNYSICLLQNITFARIHKGSNKKLVFRCNSLPSFCSQAWQRIRLDLVTWYKLWHVLSRSEEDWKTVELFYSHLFSSFK